MRDTLNREDEAVRFETRLRIMEAAHELVERIDFNTALSVEVTTKSGITVDLVYEDRGSKQGITCGKWSANYIADLKEET